MQNNMWKTIRIRYDENDKSAVAFIEFLKTLDCIKIGPTIQEWKKFISTHGLWNEPQKLNKKLLERGSDVA